MSTQGLNDLTARHHQRRIRDIIDAHQIRFLRRRRLLNTLRPGTLLTLVEHGYVHPLPERVIRECVQNKSFVYLNDIAAYLADATDITATPIGKYTLLAHLKGLVSEAEPRIRFRHYSEASLEERALQRIIIKATATISSEHVSHYDDSQSIAITRLASDHLISYLMKHPDKAEGAVDLINAGRIGTTEESLNTLDDLLAVRNETATPLADGAL